nr:hypothetical protein CFP56_22030 [Quercus suber]
MPSLVCRSLAIAPCSRPAIAEGLRRLIDESAATPSIIFDQQRLDRGRQGVFPAAFALRGMEKADVSRASTTIPRWLPCGAHVLAAPPGVHWRNGVEQHALVGFCCRVISVHVEKVLCVGTPQRHRSAPLRAVDDKSIVPVRTQPVNGVRGIIDCHRSSRSRSDGLAARLLGVKQRQGSCDTVTAPFDCLARGVPSTSDASNKPAALGYTDGRGAQPWCQHEAQSYSLSLVSEPRVCRHREADPKDAD